MVARRTQQEEDLRENHPLFDTPLFAVGRDSRVRKLCCAVVQARHRVPLDRDPVTGNLLRVPYRRLQYVFLFHSAVPVTSSVRTIHMLQMLVL